MLALTQTLEWPTATTLSDPDTDSTPEFARELASYGVETVCSGDDIAALKAGYEL